MAGIPNSPLKLFFLINQIFPCTKRCLGFNINSGGDCWLRIFKKILNSIFLILTTHSIVLPFLYMEKMKTATKKLKPKDLPVIDPWAFLWGVTHPLPLDSLTIIHLYPRWNLLSRNIFGSGDVATSNPHRKEKSRNAHTTKPIKARLSGFH